MKLLEFLQEDNGVMSSTRLALLLWVVGVLAAWLVMSIRAGSLQAIDSSIQTVLGILVTGKVTQKFGEKPAVPAPPDNAHRAGDST